MPNHKHAKVRVLIRDDFHNNNNHPEIIPHEVDNQNNNLNQQRPTMFKCCLPTPCPNVDEFIDDSDPVDAVRVVCNNEVCTGTKWMHRACFDEWEQSVLSYLRSCGRARSWSEKQRLQNLWSKKGYDLAFKACDCHCGRGHLRKDLDYIPVARPLDNRNKKRNKKKSDKPIAVMGPVSAKTVNSHTNGHIAHGNGNSNIYFTQNGGTPSTMSDYMPPVSERDSHVNGVWPNSNALVSHNSNVVLNPNSNANDYDVFSRDSVNNKCLVADFCNSVSVMNLNSSVVPIMRPQFRLRAGSFSSTGSSPPNSAGSGSPLPMSPATPNGSVYRKQSKFDFFGDLSHATTGNIFKRRNDFTAFNILPRHKQNPYHIKMEDEGPHGNDDTRCFVLSNLSSYKVTSLECVFCKVELHVFERYPLIDGTFFLSPQPYSDGVVQLQADGKLQYLNAVCVSCLEGATDVRCYACKSKWVGSNLLLGTMYNYDIFAAAPCCQKRLTCKSCHRAVVDVTRGLPFFSEYSRLIECPYCKAKDTHFIRPLPETFQVKYQSICK